VKDPLLDSRYSTRYSDSRGVETATIENDGDELRLALRGVVFAGRMFDDFKPLSGSDPALISQFTLQRGRLCAYSVTCEIPVSLVIGERMVETCITVQLELGEPAERGGLDHVLLKLSLVTEHGKLESRGESGWFEDELLELQAALPAGTYLKTCINCAFSDYSPYGHGLFGCLFCFRNCKDEYVRVKDKDGLFAIWNRTAGAVQETYLCSEFARRKPGTGYRG
jgi:hypothetical protein